MVKPKEFGQYLMNFSDIFFECCISSTFSIASEFDRGLAISEITGIFG